MNPKISICVPNLNMRPFLPERFASIFNQTFSDWELLVYDSHSDDGAWEYIQELALREKRMHIWQGPKEGIYPAWNACLREARGDYVYIATSDDTMAPDCLAKLVAALEKHPECDLAHCPVRIIDENGRALSFPQWPGSTSFALCENEWLTRPHIRKAPYDGLLHMLGKSVYLSFIQLLVRRTLFAEIGEFPTKWGSAGDLNWQMKAGLVASTVHVPGTWAAWRIHKNQATDFASISAHSHLQKFDAMLQDAVDASAGHLMPAITKGLRSHWLDWSRNMREYEQSSGQHRTFMQRRVFQMTQLVRGTSISRRYLLGRMRGKPEWLDAAPAELRQWLESLGEGPVLIPDSK